MCVCEIRTRSTFRLVRFQATSKRCPFQNRLCPPARETFPESVAEQSGQSVGYRFIGLVRRTLFRSNSSHGANRHAAAHEPGPPSDSRTTSGAGGFPSFGPLFADDSSTRSSICGDAPRRFRARQSPRREAGPFCRISRSNSETGLRSRGNEQRPVFASSRTLRLGKS